MRYDGILFGNGLSINLLNQLKQYVPLEKQYLLLLDDFIRCWIDGKLSERENGQLYRFFYGNSKDRWKYFEIMKSLFKSYYAEYDSNIEYAMGCLLFKDEKMKDCIQIFPSLYNIWHIILKDYLIYLGLEFNIKKFYESVSKVIKNTDYIWTTNFDLFAESIKVKHIHGRFVSNIKSYSDVIYKYIDNGERYYFKYVWGHNGIGKMSLIEKLKQYKDSGSYFDFDFFFSNDLKMDKLLIYGMGFKPSGVVNEMKATMPRYNRAALGAIIDEHILIRVAGMQNLGILNQVDIVYYDEREKEYFEEVVYETKIEKYNLIPSSLFNFLI